jgi:hypothetical protein
MIPKASQRGGGKDLATHLMNAFDNEYVELAEVSGAVAQDLHGAFAEWEAVAHGLTKCRNYLYSLSINPDPYGGGLSRAQYHDYVARVEKALGLEGHVSWPADVLAAGGAIVTLAYDGSPDILFGLIRRGDEPKHVADDEGAVTKQPGISAALTEALTTEKSSIVARALTGNVPVALAAVVHALALQAFHRFAGARTCLQVVLRHGAHDDEALGAWAESLPENPEDLWPWCLSQSQDRLLALLAFIAGQTVDAVQRKSDAADSHRLVHGDALARALEIDMTKAFTPTADNYFARVSSAQIVTALCEAKGVPAAPSWSKMKKADLAVFAAREVAGTGWLPDAMRLRDDTDADIDEAACPSSATCISSRRRRSPPTPKTPLVPAAFGANAETAASSAR